jgi:DNA modification methylase
VFDPFMGSGTVGIVCVNMGLNFIGCEINPGFYEVAEKRMKQAVLQPQLSTPSNTASSRLFEGWGELPAVANQSESDLPA